jgi:hypothetical protein
MVLQNGSLGPAVQELQGQLGQLGFYDGRLDGDFGARTEQAVKDFQRRVGLTPDGKVGPNTAPAIRNALDTPTAASRSCFKAFNTLQKDLFARQAADEEHLAFLDRGIDAVRPGDVPSLPARQFDASPFKGAIPRFPASLTLQPDGVSVRSPAEPAAAFKPYPALGQLPSFASGQPASDQLAFLSDEIQQACLCIGAHDLARSTVSARWCERNGLANVQFWSATKFLQVVDVVCQANRVNPSVQIADCRIRGIADNDGALDLDVASLLRQMVTYQPSIDRSNAIALMFKRLGNPGEPDVQHWLANLTGNGGVQFLGGYGANPLIAKPELHDAAAALVGPRDLGTSNNRVSAYDLVRLLTMVAWHPFLPPAAQLPNAQWHSLATVIQGLGADTARYVDVALQELGLVGVIQSPVVVSKLGFGTLDQGTDALTYAAFVQFVDPRSTPALLRSFAFALRIPTSAADGPRHDAKMASEVTELVRRVVSDELP